MKKLLVFSMLAFSMLFLACEEDVIPIPLPPPAQAVGTEPVAEEKAEPSVTAEKPSEPVKVAKAPAKEAPAKVVKEAPVKEAPPAREPPRTAISWGDDVEQSSKGRYVIQIGIVPAEASAKKMIKKLAESGIKAYNAKVDNPNPEKGMIGTYNRVRIGFFEAKSSAEAFAKARLEPLGYSWWVDKGRNDNIGKVAFSSEPEPVFEVERIPEKKPKQMTEQERKDAERAAAIAAAKEEYKAIAKAANASVSSTPAVPPPKIPAKTNTSQPVIKTTDETSQVKKTKSKRQQQ